MGEYLYFSVGQTAGIDEAGVVELVADDQIAFTAARVLTTPKLVI